MEEKLRIRLHVYDTELAVKINRDDEPLYRAAGRLITDTVNTYAAAFNGKKTEKDILYMALIDIALKYQRETKRNDTEPFRQAMQDITREIEDALQTDTQQQQ